jgi:hypothetical protein
MSSPSEYIVTRVWVSRHKKQTYHISVGPFATRARAEGFKKRAIKQDLYPPEELFVSMLRPLSHDRYAEYDLGV